MASCAARSPFVAEPAPANVAQKATIVVELVKSRSDLGRECNPRGEALVEGRDEIIAALLAYEFRDRAAPKIVRADLSNGWSGLSAVAGIAASMAMDLRTERGVVVATRGHGADAFCVDVHHARVSVTRIVIDHYLELVE